MKQETTTQEEEDFKKHHLQQEEWTKQPPLLHMANADTDIDIDIESTTTTKPTNFIVMTTYWDKWSRCIGSRYQRDHMYQVGRLDTCSKQWKDFKIAARAKVIQWKEPARAKEMIQNTYYKK
jgi:hypothetical protein